MIDETHDPSLRSWVESANRPDTDFPIQNLPFATFRENGTTHLGVAIGDRVLDVTEAFAIASMRDVMTMPRAARSDFRRRISAFLSEPSPDAGRYLHPMASVHLLHAVALCYESATVWRESQGPVSRPV